MCAACPACTLDSDCDALEQCCGGECAAVTATCIHVSNDGDDANDGLSEATPWQTLDAVNAHEPSPGDVVMFRRGDTWTGTLTVPASGADGSPIEYRSYGSGAKPKIVGSAPITDWTLHEGEIYKASWNTDITQLVVDGMRMRAARTPNTGYHFITSALSATQFTSTDLDASMDYTGATWVGRACRYWFSSKNVTASSGQTLTIDSEAYWDLDPGEGFFLTGKLAFLDAPGEWYFDSATSTVYLWTPSGDAPENHSVLGSVHEHGVHMSGRSHVTVKGLSIEHSAADGIRVDNSQHVRLEGNDVVEPDASGIYYNGSDGEIVGNHVRGGNVHGIRVLASSTTITHNEVADTGRLENIGLSAAIGAGTAIGVRGGSNHIVHNLVLHAGYHGIAFAGIDNIVEYNFIDGATEVLDDGGGIYTYSGNYAEPGSAGSVVHNNIVLNVHGQTLGTPSDYGAACGIYIDDDIHDVVVQNNTVAHSAAGIFLHNNGLVDVTDNLVFDTILHFLLMGNRDDNNVTQNTFVAANRRGNFNWFKDTHQRMVFETAGTALYDHNFYVQHYESDSLFPQNHSFSEWQAASGQDANSSFDGGALSTGEEEKLYYNASEATVTVDLGGTPHRDLEGNPVGTLDLGPYEAQVLIAGP